MTRAELAAQRRIEELERENVRLFNETKQSLERQTAISDILRVISSSPTDVQPVLDAIADSAIRFCAAEHAIVNLTDGSMIRPGAGDLTVTEPFALDRSTVTGRSMVDARTYSIHDLADPVHAAEFPLGHSQALRSGERSIVATPMVRDGQSIGGIVLWRTEPNEFTDTQVQLVETFAAQAVIAIENVRLFNVTKDALEQQTATSQVLQSISRAAFDLQVVLDTVVERAAQLCGAEQAWMRRLDGGEFRFVAYYGASDDLRAMFEDIRSGRVHDDRRVDSSGMGGRAVHARRPIHVHDIATDPQLRDGSLAKRGGARTALAVPMLRDGEPIGALVVARNRVAPFSEREIRLVETFSDQAVIAIENVRLFTETKEALEQQTAVSDVLATISRSEFDLPSVLQTISERAVDLAKADTAAIHQLEGHELVVVARHAPPHVRRLIPPVGSSVPLDGPTLAARSVRTLEPHYVADVRTDPSLPQAGTLTRLAVPIQRDGRALGSLVVARVEAIPFTDRQRSLIATFADQAAIAIENVRLFNETKESLERQTAISEILRVMSSSPTDVQPVLDAVAASARRFCQAEDAAVILWREGDMLDFVAHDGPLPGRNDDEEPWPMDRTSVTGRSMVERKLVHVHDLLAEPDDEYPKGKAQARQYGHRTTLAAPLLREGHALGALLLRRNEVRPFSDAQLGLVRTFADQAAIAIENVRLFNETKESLERQTAIAEILRLISESPTDVQPVLDGIAQNVVRFCAAENAVVMLERQGELRAVAHVGQVPQPDGLAYPIDRDTLTGRAFLDGETLLVNDMHAPEIAAAYPRGHAMALKYGWRTAAITPLLREGHAIGTITLERTAVRPFTEKQLDLLRTFAAQAVIAIENVRLFNETTESLERQTAIADVLKAMSGQTFELEPVLQTVIENATRLAGAQNGFVYLREGDEFRERAGTGPAYTAALHELHERTPLKTGDRGRMVGRVSAERRTIHITDVLEDPEYTYWEAQKLGGFRTMLGVPMIREREVVGVVSLWRTEARPFSEGEIALVETFADQAAIAIENVRLFNEIRDKSAQLEVASRHKSEFLANMSHELRTPLNAIIGFSEVLIQGMFGELNAKQREYLDDVLSSGRHLLSLINDILDLAKIEAGRVELELAEFSLPAALENGMTMVRERAGRQGIRLDLEVKEVDRIVADERKVKQVVFNLLSNAVKFTPDGGRVAVRAEAHDGEVHVAVRDTGIGIDAADRERIFEEFQQAGRDPERSREGTGLGLSLSRRYVELHGGRIWVESEPGQGSTFTFALPLRQRSLEKSPT